MIDPRSDAHNYVVVAGVRSPGRAELTGCSRPFKYQIIPSYGREGARTVYTGRDIARPTLTLWFWKPEHFVQWEAFKVVLGPPSITKPLVTGMQHPKLSAADIKDVAVEDLGEPDRQPSGIWVATIKLIEWRPLKPVLVTPRGSVPAPNKPAAAGSLLSNDLQAALAKAQSDLIAERNRAR